MKNVLSKQAGDYKIGLISHKILSVYKKYILPTYVIVTTPFKQLDFYTRKLYGNQVIQKN